MAFLVLAGWAWASIRLGALHPNPWPLVALLGLLGVGVVVAWGAGLVGLARGHRRVLALGMAVAAILPLLACGAVGLYAMKNWQRRLVPADLPTALAKMGGAALIRLEASFEYPNRAETGRLVMFFDRIWTPQTRDLAAMDEHLARLEGLLGGRLRSPVFWVRGRVRVLDLGGLSVHGIALGSDASPQGLGRGGERSTATKLAHAAIDEFRPVDADPPFLFSRGVGRGAERRFPGDPRPAGARSPPR